MELAHPSTALAREPELTFDGRRLTIGVEFAVSGAVQRQQIVFEPARAFRFVAEPYCEAWHYELAYDRVAEVEQSSWLAEVEGRASPAASAGRHLVLTVDSWGCLEVLAGGVELVSTD